MSSRINAVCVNENQTYLSELLAIKTFILFNNTFLCILGDIFGLIGKFVKISIFNILTGQKRDMTELKFGLAGQHDRPPFKNYFEP